MYSYPIDVDPEQVVRWLIVERQKGSRGLEISAVRGNEAKELPVQMDLQLGDEEREELSDTTTVATLEIAPVRSRDGWRLILSVEEELDASSKNGEAEGGEEPIDLDTFYLEFLRPGRGTANLTAQVEDSEAEARLAELLGAIETNSHPADFQAPRA